MLCKYTLENGACMRVEVVWDPAAIGGKTAAVSPSIVLTPTLTLTLTPTLTLTLTLTVQEWRGLRALALCALGTAARAQRLATLLDFRPEVRAEISDISP